MSIQKKRILTFGLFLLVGLVCFALEDPQPPAPPVIPPGLPIDGGVFIGVLFALFYGAKKIIKNNN